MDQLAQLFVKIIYGCFKGYMLLFKPGIQEVLEKRHEKNSGQCVYMTNNMDKYSNLWVTFIIILSFFSVSKVGLTYNLLKCL